MYSLTAPKTTVPPIWAAIFDVADPEHNTFGSPFAPFLMAFPDTTSNRMSAAMENLS